MTEGAERNSSPALSYQPSLDGIRALAVLSVMAYHGGLSWAHAGFLGVDVFLVLSGFLITYLLVLEIENHGTVNRRAFWMRRARRLLPALFAVLIAVGLYAVFFATAADRSQIRSDSLGSLFYVQNWHLIAQGQSYFAQFGTPSPLRPMWSLAIEEQWYIVWPLLFLFLVRVTRGSLARLAGITCALAAVSAFLMVSLYRPGHDPSRVYYGTDTRAQALLLGAVLAFVFAARPDLSRAPARFIIQLLGALGGLALLLTVVITDDTSTMLYRGGFTLVALAAAALIAAAMTPGPVRDVLGVRPLAAIGLISYGLYLWHWPIFMLMTPARVGLTGGGLAVARFAAAFAVATASYFLLERPVRRGTWTWVARPQRWVPIGAAAVVGCLLLTTSGLFPAPESASATPRPLQDLESGTVSTASKHDAPADRPNSAATRFVLAGDSVAFTLGWFGVPKPLQRDAWVQGAAVIGCGIANGDGTSDGVRLAEDPRCARWPGFYRDTVEKTRPDVSVLLIGAWEIYDRIVDGQTLDAGTEPARDHLFARLDIARAALTSTGAPLVLLTAPCFDPVRQELGKWGEADHAEAWRVDWLNQVLRQYARQHRENVVIGDLHRLLCPGGKFAADVDGIRVRGDGEHFTEEGSAYTFDWLVPLVRRVARDRPLPPTDTP